MGEALNNAKKQKEERNKSILSVIEQVDFEVLNILESFIQNIRILNSVIYGIVAGSGGTYDTLSNISSIGGRSNTELRESFKQISSIISKTYDYISEMKILEERKL